jgi:hypothetical protein
MSAFTGHTVIHDNDADILGPHPRRRWIGTVAGPTSYDAGGSDHDLAAQASVTGTIQKLDAVEDDGARAYIARWDRPNNKIKVYVAATGAEVAGGVDLSAITFRLDVEAKV